ncbi:motility associated factor glycosyltransferase family protein [Campylobacter jejuni]|uniref:motility associated factor glycosyltransferase family protein n=1 Tax=Campylobacter sp. US55 TaxID=2498126 RepID=UPI0010686264|nr:motility associated factor glycosyltransferase family protein [Campylobacter sp. US55]EAI4882263.1 motility associated factor glycosyltransferase family protein [Campylobacter jejuni]EAI8344901.1 motility associated factor glycosyltransferase family protein [Campylobacter jejuni]ECL9116888.1 motility associated factor glycosyltransferase family protein [Campylobacter jejuni]ECL9191627.1 motility associated factor glycosyltransferase family protein [Campylobacter jejuni]ECP5966703.1 motility
MNQNLFLKNTQALFEVDQILAYKLRALEKNDFKILQNENGINFIKDNITLYKNPEQELLENLTLFQNKYKKYPVLFFYGFGNGMFYKALCENKNHKHIIVFEDELEILALALHLFDFSKELKNEKLILFHTPNITTAQLTTLFMYEYIQKSVKIFNLFVHSDFYLKFYAHQIQELNKKLIENIRFIVLAKGNDPYDSIIGIKHMLNNLPKLLNHGIFQNFLKERKQKIKNAIIVSTGPSLIKQLPLLKKYANKATIFCADSAYPILAKHDIKPDYVCMLERDDIVSKCFDNDFKEFDKGILFILASVVHKEVIEFLERNNREYMLAHRPLHFAVSLNLKEFGYIGVGASVANMAYELAASLRHENIILIGQDLAYAEDGSSHPREHIYGNEGEKIRGEVYTLAYGGEKQVRTQLTWNLFRQAFEKDIFWAKEKLKINTYNCTEGGARIEGTIERPFKEVCETLLKEDLEKPFDKPKILENNEIKNKFLQTQKLLIKNVEQSEKFIKKCQNELKKLDFELSKSQLNLQALIKIKQNLLIFFKDFKRLKLFNELTQAIYYHNECEIVHYEVLNDLEQNEKIKDFLTSQEKWWIQSFEYLNTQNQIIKEALKKYKNDDILVK